MELIAAQQLACSITRAFSLVMSTESSPGKHVTLQAQLMIPRTPAVEEPDAYHIGVPSKGIEIDQGEEKHNEETSQKRVGYEKTQKESRDDGQYSREGIDTLFTTVHIYKICLAGVAIKSGLPANSQPVLHIMLSPQQPSHNLTVDALEVRDPGIDRMQQDKEDLELVNRIKTSMPSGPKMLRQHRTIRTRRVPIVDSDSEDEPTTIPDNSSSPLKSPNLRIHTLLSHSYTNTQTRIREWRKLVCREAYLDNPDAIAATYPDEWLHEKLTRLRSPDPSNASVPLDWTTTTADTRAKMNITAAENMDMVAQALRNSSQESLFDEAFGELEKHWREELRGAVLRKKALHSQGLLQRSSFQKPTEDFHGETEQRKRIVASKE